MTMMAIFKNYKTEEIRKLTKQNDGRVFYEGVNAQDERIFDVYLTESFEQAITNVIRCGFTLEYIK